MRVLVVEDERKMAEVLRRGLTRGPRARRVRRRRRRAGARGLDGVRRDRAPVRAGHSKLSAGMATEVLWRIPALR
jgi:hypothetical protein